MSATQQVLPKDQYWEVNVPARKLGLVFVSGDLCPPSR